MKHGVQQVRLVQLNINQSLTAVMHGLRDLLHLIILKYVLLFYWREPVPVEVMRYPLQINCLKFILTCKISENSLY